MPCHSVPLLVQPHSAACETNQVLRSGLRFKLHSTNSDCKVLEHTMVLNILLFKVFFFILNFERGVV